MCFKFIPHSALSVVVLLVAAAVSADQRVWPTGTPTWIPKKSTATPVPEPLTEIETEARKLGEELAVVDKGVWAIVNDHWDDEALCLEKVDAHLAAAKDDVTGLLRESEVMTCQADQAGGLSKLALTSEEARKAFVSAYHPAVVELRAVRGKLTENPESEAVVETVRQRQKSWQNSVCEGLDTRKQVKPRKYKMLDRPASSSSES